MQRLDQDDKVKKKSASWYTLKKEDEKGLIAAMPIAMNRKARQAYKRIHGGPFKLPPVLMPYKKPEEPEKKD